MKELIKPLEQYFNYENLVVAFLSVLVSLIVVYFKSKVKDKALKKTKFELAELKKYHDLEIMKRKYEYEGKRDAYKNLLDKIDSFNSKVYTEITTAFYPEVKKFWMDFDLKSSKNHQKKVTTKFISSSMNFAEELNSEFRKVKYVNNDIWLHASTEIINLLIEISEKVNKVQSESEKYAQKMPQNVQLEQEDERMVTNLYDQHFLSSVESIDEKIKELRLAMKTDLNSTISV